MGPDDGNSATLGQKTFSNVLKQSSNVPKSIFQQYTRSEKNFFWSQKKIFSWFFNGEFFENLKKLKHTQDFHIWTTFFEGLHEQKYGWYDENKIRNVSRDIKMT